MTFKNALKYPMPFMHVTVCLWGDLTGNPSSSIFGGKHLTMMADENTPHVQAKFFTKQSQYVFYLNVVFVFPET